MTAQLVQEVRHDPTGGMTLTLFKATFHQAINHLPDPRRMAEYERQEQELRRELKEAERTATGPIDEQSAGPRECPVSGRACHWDNDAEAFIAEWAHQLGGGSQLPPAHTIAATLSARRFTMQSDLKRSLSLRAVGALLNRMTHEGLI